MEEHSKRGYLMENFRVFHLKSKGAAQVEYHYHEFCKILMLVQGSGGYFIDGQRYLLQPGDIILLDSHSIHRPELDVNAPYERIILYISPEFLQQQSTESCALRNVFFGGRGHILRLPENQKRIIFRIAAALEQEVESTFFGHEILSNAALLRLLVEIRRSQEGAENSSLSPVMPKNQRIVEILRYIDEHLEEDLDVEVLAKVHFISKYHMMRLFHQETGTTIHVYLTQKRLIRARELMDTGMRATDACYRCGWKSYSSFTRAYNKYLGTTPTGRMDEGQVIDADFE